MSDLSDMVFGRASARLELQGAVFRAFDAGLSESDIKDMVDQSIHDYVPESERAIRERQDDIETTD